MGWRFLAAAFVFLPAAALAGKADYASLIPILRAHDARLMSIGWRLATGNAALCRSNPRAIGAMLMDSRDFERPGDARTAMRIAGDVAIAAVASGSPAEAAGLRGGEELRAVDGARVSSKAQAYDRIEAVLGARDTVSLTIAALGQGERTLAVPGTRACAGRFELIMGSKIAKAENQTVFIGVELLGEHPSDDEAATMVAHEMAHNILAHLDRLEAGTRNYVTIRRTEREADGLAPWLMANAGYDPAAAPRFIAAWGPRHSGGATRMPNHDSWQDRAELMRSQLPRIAAARASAAQGPLDWRSGFPGQDGRPAR